MLFDEVDTSDESEVSEVEGVSEDTDTGVSGELTGVSGVFSGNLRDKTAFNASGRRKCNAS